MTKKLLILLYAMGGYLAGIASLLYLMGFIINIGIPKGIDDGDSFSFWWSVVINASLITLFGLHHSLTARTSFKKWVSAYIPAPAQRATYLYLTALITAVLVFFWQPINLTIWQLEHPYMVNVILAVYFSLWITMVLCSFPIGHFHLLGLAHAWNNFLNKCDAEPPFSRKFLYGLVRHPISSCWILIAWCTPVMTVGHLIFSVGVTVYILIATPHEEHDLAKAIGPPYLKYQKEVPPFLPSLTRPTKSTHQDKR
ncbi:methyltransferase family protein [Kangiella sp. M94]